MRAEIRQQIEKASQGSSSQVAQFAAKVVEANAWMLPLRKDWEEMSLDDAHKLIQNLHACYLEGANIFNQRTATQSREDGFYHCMVCRKKKPQVIDNHPNYVWRDDRQDPQTRIYTTKFICSSECFFRGSNSGKLTNAGERGDVHK